MFTGRGEKVSWHTQVHGHCTGLVSLWGPIPTWLIPGESKGSQVGTREHFPRWRGQYSFAQQWIYQIRAHMHIYTSQKLSFAQICLWIHTHTIPHPHLTWKPAGTAHFEDPIRLSVYLTTFQPPRRHLFLQRSPAEKLLGSRSSLNRLGIRRHQGVPGSEEGGPTWRGLAVAVVTTWKVGLGGMDCPRRGQVLSSLGARRTHSQPRPPQDGEFWRTKHLFHFPLSFGPSQPPWEAGACQVWGCCPSHG